MFALARKYIKRFYALVVQRFQITQTFGNYNVAAVQKAVEYVISSAERAKPDKEALLKFKNKLCTAKTLCYLHDNCGEIVLDKILIKVIRRLYTQIKVKLHNI